MHGQGNLNIHKSALDLKFNGKKVIKLYILAVPVRVVELQVYWKAIKKVFSHIIARNMLFHFQSQKKEMKVVGLLPVAFIFKTLVYQF